MIVIVWLTLSALVGLRRGFAAQVLALAGFAAGAWLGSRLAPYALSDSARAEWEPVAALLGAVIGGAMVQAATNPLANAVRRRVLIGRWRPSTAPAAWSQAQCWGSRSPGWWR